MASNGCTGSIPVQGTNKNNVILKNQPHGLIGREVVVKLQGVGWNPTMAAKYNYKCSQIFNQ